MRYGMVVAGASLLALGGCGSADREGQREPTPAVAAATAAAATADAGAAPTPPAPVSTPARATPIATRSCAAELGQAAAQRLARVCRNVSPATRPPCNAANSCAMIQDEIARSCALFDGDGPPMAGCTTDPKGMEAAADVVRRYYAALDAHDYATAWTQWGNDGRPGQSFTDFRNGFAHTRSTRVTIGALTRGDAGAGSSYQPVPVTVDATLDDGSHQRFAGTYIVRRVNGIDGATPDQLRWHLDSAKLRRVS